MFNKFMCISTIVLLFFFKESSALNWTWYIYSTSYVSGSPGYFDLTIGIKANSSGDAGRLGNHTLRGTMSTNLYDFGGSNDPILQTNHLVGNYTITLTNPTGTNNWQINSVYNGSTGSGDQVATIGIRTETIRFYISNPSGTSNVTLGSLQQTYEDDNLTKSTVTYDNTGGDASLPVQMGKVEATAMAGEGIALAWHTESEANSAGFHVWRSQTENGSYGRVSTSLIASRGNGSSATAYKFVDKNVLDGNEYWYKIEEISTDGQSEFFGPISVQGIPLPTEYSLSQNFPNPFNPETTIKYELPEVSEVSVKVFTLLGKEVKTLVNKTQNIGRYEVKWNGLDNGGKRVSSGIYFVRIQAGSYSQIRKMTFIQ